MVNPNIAAPDTPPQVDTPASDDAAILADLGTVVSAGEQAPAQPPAQGSDALPDPNEVPEALMRDDYLKRLNQLHAMKQELEAQKAAIAAQAKPPQAGERPGEDGQDQPPPMPKIGEGTILAHFGLDIDPRGLESDNEKAMYKALKVMESVLERHMIATDVHVQKMQKVAQSAEQMGQAHQQQSVAQAQKLLGGAIKTIKESYGVQVDAKAIAASARRYGRGLIEKAGGGQVTQDVLVQAWLIDNPETKKVTPQLKAPAAKPAARAAIPPVNTPNKPPNTPGAGSGPSPRTRLDDDAQILADLQAALSG